MTEDQIIELALKSLIQEVSLYPKPGLVDPVDCGAHIDMDYYTFIDSCFALLPGFRNYYRTGAQHKGTLKELFEKIRIVGLENEKLMFKATKNINTHKGANFLYGVVISAWAYSVNPNLEDLRSTIKEMTEGLVESELESLKDFSTHGEVVYKNYGFTGIRGEVEKGIPLVFETVLPILNNHEDYHLSLKMALLELIKLNNDSNILKRGGIEGLEFAKRLANQPYENLDRHLIMMNESFIQKNLSPGGTADLLALSIFINMLIMSQSDQNEENN